MASFYKFHPQRASSISIIEGEKCLNKRKNILIITHAMRVLKDFETNNNKRNCWGIIELQKKHCVTIVELDRLQINLKQYLFGSFEILYLHSMHKAETLLFALSLLKFIPFLNNKKIVILMHSTPLGKGEQKAGWLKRLYLRICFLGVDKLLFFSPKSLEETISYKFAKQEKCVLVHWGDDLDFINLHTPTCDYDAPWISNGKENRDMDTLQQAFCESIHPTTIVTKDTFLNVFRQTLNSKGVVIILDEKALTYCTGLTCLVEACALGKPIISTRNTYYPFDIEKEGVGIYVDEKSTSQIVHAINLINTDKTIYMRMSTNCLRMAKIYNMENFTEELLDIIDSL